MLYIVVHREDQESGQLRPVVMSSEPKIVSECLRVFEQAVVHPEPEAEASR